MDVGVTVGGGGEHKTGGGEPPSGGFENMHAMRSGSSVLHAASIPTGVSVCVCVEGGGGAE